MKFEEILEFHIKRYPLIEAADLVKLAYQSEFGAGHIISDIDSARARFYKELSETPTNPKAPLTEDIGDGLLRVNFAAFTEYRIPCEKLFYVFVEGAKKQRGSRWGFDRKLDVLLKSEVLNFKREELKIYLNEYMKNLEKDEIPPPVSHSKAYRDAYAPHYRVVDATLLEKETEIKNV